MVYTNDNIKKICNFYVSDWHLAVMLLPYINKEINKGTKITTVFQNNMKNNIETLVRKLNLKNEKEILQIDWNTKNNSILERYVKENLSSGEENLFIINGDKEYVEKSNEKVIEYIGKNKTKKNFIKIVDCYEVEQNEEKMYNIIKMHDCVLNTSGEHNIEKII
ncbi:unknown [Clostridium sp. CAG:571]|jgi:hypothetical protein|nr:unknown [Clostridium sp. CAG:571]HJJ06629.1 hypothetical protein [Clostridiaceae bacterium]